MQNQSLTNSIQKSFIADKSMSVIDTILNTYKDLSTFSSLAPSPAINQAFENLVRIIKTPYSQEIISSTLGDARIKDIQEELYKICAEGESLLEAAWADRVLKSDDVWATLREFPYYQSYVSMVGQEVALLARKSHRALFIGSGPLPLTAILLAIQHDMDIVCLDSDSEALFKGARVVEKLGLCHRIKFICADGKEFSIPKEINVTFVAALVGDRVKEKEAVITHVTKTAPQNSAIVLRTAEGLATLVYRPVELSWIREAQVKTIARPTDGNFINSSLIAVK
jgi:nicotianamine synthase